MTGAIVLLAAAALPSGPLDFKARDMRIEAQDRRVVLDGDVHLSRDDLNVTGEHAVAEYAKEQHAPPRRPRRRKEASDAILGGQSVERFTAIGNVHVQRASRTADGEHG